MGENNHNIAAFPWETPSAPKPGLCDSCQHAGGFWRDGTITVGNECYAQRYCNVPHDGVYIGIALGGVKSCNEYSLIDAADDQRK